MRSSDGEIGSLYTMDRDYFGEYWRRVVEIHNGENHKLVGALPFVQDDSSVSHCDQAGRYFD